MTALRVGVMSEMLGTTLSSLLKAGKLLKMFFFLSDNHNSKGSGRSVILRINWLWALFRTIAVSRVELQTYVCTNTRAAHCQLPETSVGLPVVLVIYDSTGNTLPASGILV